MRFKTNIRISKLIWNKKVVVYKIVDGVENYNFDISLSLSDFRWKGYRFFVWEPFTKAEDAPLEIATLFTEAIS